MDRGRPIGRDSKRQRSRTRSETNEPEPPVQDNWKLPRGMRARDAAMRMNDADKGQLHKQAYDQADKFEVLHKRDVASLSRVSSFLSTPTHTHVADHIIRSSEHLTSAATTSASTTSLYVQAVRSFIVV
jgi:LAS superfamily LD-carboxypeptidase LdcB